MRQSGIVLTDEPLALQKHSMLVHEVEASCIALQYRKSLRRPALSAKLILDGDADHPVSLNGTFEESWGDCQYLEPVLHHGKRMRHTLEITVSEGESGAVPFYLMAVIVS